MSSRLEVHKFGGTSVADATRMRGVAAIIAGVRARASAVVVTSATAGTTDALLTLAARAAAGEQHQALLAAEALEARHLGVAAELGASPVVQEALQILLDDLRSLVLALAVTRELSARTRDRLVVIGEKLAAVLLAHALRAAGCPAEAAFADAFLDTDDHFGEARPLGGVYERTTQAALRPILAEGRVPVVTGFSGRAPDGSTTTLGRGGSDLSATLLAAALSADEVTIWTDVDGVFSADPRVVPGARVIRHLNYREAAEMSFYGAKVLHQRTMIPAQGRRIPVVTRNSLRPDAEGTVVDARFTPGSHPVKAVSAVRAQALLSVEGKGMAGVPGVSARVFGALAARQISVTMISQASSESSICLALPAHQAEEAALALREAFRPELSRGEVEEVGLRPGVGLVAVVGLGMAHTRGVAARAMTACADAGVNILAIAQGSSELNITLALDEADLARGVRALHEGFGLHRIDPGVDDPDALNLVLLGLGGIGQALLRLLEERRAHVRARFGLTPRVVAVVDRSGFLLAPAGLDAATLAAAVEAKAQRRGLASLPGGRPGDAQAALRAALEYRLTRPILVDASDADGAAAVFEAALARGCDVVTANKKPLAGPRAAFEALRGAAAQAGRVLKAEATVGAGLPVIDTLEILLGTGDRVREVQGCLSGTLGFVMSALEAGAPLSSAVAEAKARGYTEPDPVADLSGADVARKALILARWSGLAGPDDEPEVALEGLVEPSWAGLPWGELQERLRGLDAAFAARRAEAEAAGEVWRFVARVAPGVIQVGPARVPKDSPTGRLAGTENLVMFRSDRYDAIPLVVTGPGAGVEVTAMGVLGDILRVAAERRRA
jgi:aspartokinase/homoserine dehydrogenase 1